MARNCLLLSIVGFVSEQCLLKNICSIADIEHIILNIGNSLYLYIFSLSLSVSLSLSLSVYIYIYAFIYLCIYLPIYIYTERERERNVKLTVAQRL